MVVCVEMLTICAFCAELFDPSIGGHGCPESKPKPDLIERLRYDHCDTIECEHGFMLHRDPCPNVICLGRDLAMAADRIGELEDALVKIRDGAHGTLIAADDPDAFCASYG